MLDDAAFQAAARQSMVDGQLRPSQVNDPLVLDAMRRLPREVFVPAQQRAVAYADRAVPLGGRRFLLEPLVLARMVQLARPRAAERALVVASGAGLGAALLAMLGLDVSAVETDATLAAAARTAWSDPRIGTAPRDRSGEGLAGIAASGETFALVLVDGGIERLTPELESVVDPVGGRLIAVLAPPGESGRAIIAERSGEKLSPRPLFDARAATVPGFEKPRPFRF